MSEAQVRLRIPTAQAAQDAARIRRELDGIRRMADQARGSMAQINRALAAARGPQQLTAGLTQASAAQQRLAQSTRASQASLIQQERALQRAHIQLQNIEAAVRRAGGHPAIVDQARAAYQRLEQVVSRASVSTLALSRAQASFAAAAAGARRQIADLNRQELTRFATTMQTLTTASVLAVGPLSGVGARLSAIGVLAQRGTLGLGLMIGGVTALTAGMLAAGRAGIDATLAFERIDNALRVGTGSAEDAAKAYAFVRDNARQMGFDVRSGALQFAQLAAAAKGTNLEGEATRDIFLAVSRASVALGLSTADTEGALRALQQMMSKGTVQAEELRGQLGERIPGVFQLAARAMGVTTQELNKMLERAEVLPDDLLPRLAVEIDKTFGPQAAEAATGFRAAINRVNNEFFELSRTIGGLLEGRATQFLTFLETSIRLVNRLLGGESEADALKRQLEGVRRSIQLIQDTLMQGAQPGLRGLSGLLSPTSIAEARDQLARLQQQELDLVKRLQALERPPTERRTTTPTLTLSAENQAALRNLREELAMATATEGERGLLRLQQRLDELVRKAGPAKAEAQALADQILRLAQLTMGQSFGFDFQIDPETQTHIDAVFDRLHREREMGLGAVFMISPADQVRIEEAFERFKRQQQESLFGATFLISPEDQARIEEAFERFKKQQQESLFGATFLISPEDLKRIEGAFALFRPHGEVARQFELENRILKELIAGHEVNARLLQKENQLRAEGKTLTDEARATLREYIQENLELEQTLERQREFVSSVRSLFTSAFEDVGRAITEAFVKGEGSALKFRDIADAVMISLLNRMLQLAAIRPLENFLFGSNPNQLGGVVGAIGGFLGSLIRTPVPSATGYGSTGFTIGGGFATAHGAAFLHGRVLPYARGGIVYGPTLFPMAEGTGVMGEKTPEAILPLTRTASGDLGVRAIGGGSSPVVNVFVQNNAGADVSVQTGQPRRNQAGGIDLEVIIEKKFQQFVSRGGLDTQMRNKYGLRPKLEGA